MGKFPVRVRKMMMLKGTIYVKAADQEEAEDAVDRLMGRSRKPLLDDDPRIWWDDDLTYVQGTFALSDHEGSSDQTEEELDTLLSLEQERIRALEEDEDDDESGDDVGDQLDDLYDR